MTCLDIKKHIHRVAVIATGESGYSEWVKKVDDMRCAFLDEAELPREVLMRREKGRQAVLLGRPILSHLDLGIAFLAGLLLRLLLAPILLTSAVDLVDGIGEMNGEVLVSPFVKQHLQRVPFGIAVHAVA